VPAPVLQQMFAFQDSSVQSMGLTGVQSMGLTGVQSPRELWGAACGSLQPCFGAATWTRTRATQPGSARADSDEWEHGVGRT
jgi:hypothetical protein